VGMLTTGLEKGPEVIVGEEHHHRSAGPPCPPPSPMPQQLLQLVAPLGAQGRGERACALGLAGAATGGEFTVDRFLPRLRLADQWDPLVRARARAGGRRGPRALWATLLRRAARVLGCAGGSADPVVPF
jgi:hypothetical protein